MYKAVYKHSLIIKLLFITVLIVFILSYGFIVGGAPNLLFYSIIVVISLTIIRSFMTKEFFKKKIMLVILLVCCTCMISSGLYLFINNCFDTDFKREYVSTVIEYPGNSWYETILWFKSPEGEIKQDIKYFKLIDFGYYYNSGDRITVYEYSGVFNIEHYKIEMADNDKIS